MFDPNPDDGVGVAWHGPFCFSRNNMNLDENSCRYKNSMHTKKEDIWTANAGLAWTANVAWHGQLMLGMLWNLETMNLMRTLVGTR